MSALEKLDPLTDGEKRHRERIQAGGFAVSDKDIEISTVLGSCIAACIRDERLCCGGMNHFMLPDGVAGAPTNAALHGGFAMESLINELQKLGANRKRLQAKIFGGARVIDSSVDVGAKNIEFVVDYLAQEGIPLVGQDVGGDLGRSLVYRPFSGRAFVRVLPKIDSVNVEKQERLFDSSRKRIDEPSSGGIELF